MEEKDNQRSVKTMEQDTATLKENHTLAKEEVVETPDSLEKKVAEAPDSLESKIGLAVPFTITVKLGDEIVTPTRTFDQDLVTIGRDSQCHLVIDNLGASRIHAKIERIGKFFVLRDMDSKTGTFIRGNKIREYHLNSGDEIFLAKHTLVFSKQEPEQEDKNEEREKGSKTSKKEFMATIAVDFREKAKKTGGASAHLLLHGVNRRLPLNKNVVFFGKASQCDFNIQGFLIAERHALLAHEERGFVLYHLGFWRPPLVNSKPVEMATLSNGDIVEIGDMKFTFQAS